MFLWSMLPKPKDASMICDQGLLQVSWSAESFVDELFVLSTPSAKILDVRRQLASRVRAGRFAGQCGSHNVI